MPPFLVLGAKYLSRWTRSGNGRCSSRRSSLNIGVKTKIAKAVVIVVVIVVVIIAVVLSTRNNNDRSNNTSCAYPQE